MPADRRERPLYAVLIDADNIPAKYAGAIMKEITSFGEPALRRVYADWSRQGLNAWADRILDLGLVAHQETANTKGKNASDIGLVIDAMDILHSGRFDGFVLVSSDSDFTRLASRIRESGLDVIGIGEEKTPKSLQNVCNRFVTLENIVEEEPTRAGAPRQLSKKQPPTEAIPLILKAMDKIGADDEWYPLGPLGQYITADDPAFDVRTYGKTKLSDLVKDLKRFETRKQGGQLEVRRVD
ncbi:NYN domain-containing protein [Roseitranquillus sediminis]|uniref:NYN domain-containing protein n=1 Tax=Roseitranquillus sediminis TaxID=2809051 RepID=UPI001D0C03DB|nr:NYN domain-containing protein [Roseitranquillus sediminis]MBM9593220.1 NYN domain-containing protein [Roseitranquillus sediminis]